MSLTNAIALHIRPERGAVIFNVVLQPTRSKRLYFFQCDQIGPVLSREYREMPMRFGDLPLLLCWCEARSLFCRGRKTMQ